MHLPSTPMSRRTIRIVILLALISILGIVSTQIIWVKRSFENEDKQFNDRVHIALTNVTEQILTLSQDSAFIYDPVRQQSNNSFVVQINDTLHPYLLESLLAQEFARNNLSQGFEYGIYDCFTDSIVYGGKVSLDSKVDSLSKDFKQIKWQEDGHYFGVYFPDKSRNIISGMTQWIFTSIILLVVVIFFAYAMFVILRQRRLSEVKTDFINNMTHELKTPISTIALSADVISDPEISSEPERLRQYAGIIRSENERLRLQVEKVLQIASLEKGELDLTKERIDMMALVRQAGETLTVLAQEKQGEISWELESAYVFGDKVHITNVVHNLLDNAIKYSERPHIELSLRQEGDTLLFQVKDNGRGLEKADRERVFEKFYRVSQGDRHDVKGFGLGLYYVKRIVDGHGGRVRVESERGQGSTFIVSLPAAKSSKG